MLFYKAWLESRVRFLIALLVLTGLTSYNVYRGELSAAKYTADNVYAVLGYRSALGPYYHALHSGNTALAILFLGAVNLLMMGGLLREKAAGTSAFTLALPVSRGRLMGVRIVVGLLEAAALIIVPWTAMWMVASITGKTPPLSQAGFHLVLLASGGLLFWALPLLISSLVEGEYTAPVVSFGLIVAIVVIFSDRSLRKFNPLLHLNGETHFDQSTALLQGPIPWTLSLAYLVLAGVVVVLSVTALQRRDF